MEKIKERNAPKSLTMVLAVADTMTSHTGLASILFPVDEHGCWTVDAMLLPSLSSVSLRQARPRRT